MELLLLKYGYLLLFFGVIVEGEVVLIAGSFLASRGYFNVGTVALVALAANTSALSFTTRLRVCAAAAGSKAAFLKSLHIGESSIGWERGITGCCW